MASRDIKDLDVRLQPMALDLIKRCEDSGIHIIITCTYRTGKEQDELYAQGRTKPGKIVTKARAGQSAHNAMINGKMAARAFDIVPIVNGKAVWDGDDPIWKRIGNIYKSVGNSDYKLNWYGEPNAEFHEMFHFQLARATS